MHTHGHSLLIVLSGPSWVLVRTAVSQRAVSSKKGLACWLIRSNTKAVLSLQELVEREFVLWRVDHRHGW